MDTAELKKKLNECGVPLNAFTLLAIPKDESLVLSCEGKKWIIYYFERGLRTDEQVFAKEEDACDAFFKRIIQWFKK